MPKRAEVHATRGWRAGSAIIDSVDERTESAPHVLLVDDHPPNLLVLEAILEPLACTLVRATSGDAALKAVLDHDFAVILLDVQMPSIDGYETAKHIRSRPRSRHTPIIFLTALSRAMINVSHGYAEGAVDFLFKPLDADVLRSKVSVFVELWRVREEAKERALRIEAQSRDIARLNAELEESVRSLRTANEELEAFSYSVSHDLRAPIRAIDGFGKALAEDCGDRLDDAGRDYLRRILTASARMGQLIDDLLGLARLGRGAVRHDAVDLAAIARGIAAELHERDPSRDVEIVIPDELPAHGDVQLLRIVLENLLQNAWKFTSKKPRARIEIGARDLADGRTEYFVRDDGAGFDMANVQRLFGAFQRLHTADEFTGTGIGLATVRRIVQRHGGRVRAEGVAGEGASIYFTL